MYLLAFKWINNSTNGMTMVMLLLKKIVAVNYFKSLTLFNLFDE